MIDEKKINQAVEEYLEEEGYKPYIEQAFQDGINWAQKEFINSLWHDGDENPSGCGKHIAKCLAEVEVERLPHRRELFYVITRRLYGTWDPSDFDFIEDDPLVECYRIKRWCYLSDLLPKGKI